MIGAPSRVNDGENWYPGRASWSGPGGALSAAITTGGNADTAGEAGETGLAAARATIGGENSGAALMDGVAFPRDAALPEEAALPQDPVRGKGTDVGNGAATAGPAPFDDRGGAKGNGGAELGAGFGAG